ncbi:MAG: hypothetical protein IT195_12410 [Microthrixaceae bacterium]|nr:hypothetical protein [Microthrixaceae bacterium]
MARIRTIKPEFFSSERIAKLTDAAKITFIGLWCEADDYGVVHANPRVLKGHIWPLDDTITAYDINTHLEELENGEPLIHRYTVDGKDYALIHGFTEHQKVSKPSQKRHPRPPSESPPGALPEPSGSPPSTTHPVENPLPEGYAEEREVEREMDRESSSSTGPYHQQLSTGPDDDDGTRTPTTVARAVALELGRRDSLATPTPVYARAPHALRCANNRWHTERWALTALVEQHPDLAAIGDIEALADLAETRPITIAAALHPANRPPQPQERPSQLPTRQPWMERAPATCPRCWGLAVHIDGECQIFDDLTPDEIAALERTETP